MCTISSFVVTLTVTLGRWAPAAASIPRVAPAIVAPGVPRVPGIMGFAFAFSCFGCVVVEII